MAEAPVRYGIHLSQISGQGSHELVQYFDERARLIEGLATMCLELFGLQITVQEAEPTTQETMPTRNTS